MAEILLEQMYNDLIWLDEVTLILWANYSV